MDEAKRLIARVRCGDPPAEVRTLAAWLEWRRAEDERMAAELQAQVEAFMAILDGATIH